MAITKSEVVLSSMDRRRIDKLTAAIERLADVKLREVQVAERNLRDRRAMFGGASEDETEDDHG